MPIPKKRRLSSYAKAAYYSLTDRIIERAATLYGDLSRQEGLLPDANLLIAATALDAQRTLVTNNLV